MYKQVFKKLKGIGQHTSDIECILIVGSVARGTNIMGSDLDIMIISSNKSFWYMIKVL